VRVLNAAEAERAIRPRETPRYVLTMENYCRTIVRAGCGQSSHAIITRH